MTPNEPSQDVEEHPSLKTIWTRARIRAFAHQFTADDYEERANKLYKREMKWNGLALFLLVIGLSVSDGAFIDTFDKVLGFEISGQVLVLFGKACIILSAIVAVYVFYLASVSEAKYFTSMQGRHRMSAQIFMAIAQKTRMPESHLLDKNDIKHMVFHLNEMLGVLFSCGENPHNEHYILAHKRYEELTSKDSDIPEDAKASFVPDVDRAGIT